MRTFLYPSPLHYRTVPELAYGINATILFGTDTFLAGYARVADNYDFYSVRYVFAGAERVKPETRRVWFEKFGIRILEGYGATETAPAHRRQHADAFQGGHRRPFAARHRASSRAGAGRRGERHACRVSGPNVMLGYLRAEKPGVLQPPADGWYDTGDIVDIDAEGFVTIKGRVKRFAKIAGEMVPLGARRGTRRQGVSEVGACGRGAARSEEGRAAGAADGTRRCAARAPEATAREMGLPEIFVPRLIVHVKAIPLLGTGKIDYVEAARLCSQSDSVHPNYEQAVQ